MLQNWKKIYDSTGKTYTIFNLKGENILKFFFSSFAKTISPLSGHFVKTPLGTPSRDLTTTFEYLGLLKKAMVITLINHALVWQHLPFENPFF